MSGRQHSAVKHCANYFYVPLEDDYLLAYETLAAQLDPIKEEQGKPKSASSDCKAMIAATLEAWLNSKRATAKNENDLYVYLTIDQWVQQLRYRYSRTMIIQCHNEMAEEGSCIDPETGETLVGTIKKRPYIQNMFGYLLHLPVIQSLLDALPEKSPFEMRARPALGRPKKSSQKTDGISSEESSQKLNGINSDGINEKQSKNGPNYRKSSQKTDGSFYITQNHNYTETNITQNHGVDANAQHATPTHIDEQQANDVSYSPDTTGNDEHREMPSHSERVNSIHYQNWYSDIGNDEELYTHMPPKSRHEVTIEVTQRGRAKPTADLESDTGNDESLITLSGDLGNGYMLAPIQVRVQADHDGYLVSEPLYAHHTWGTTRESAIATFKHTLLEELHFLGRDEAELGTHLQQELTYLRSIIATRNALSENGEAHDNLPPVPHGDNHRIDARSVSGPSTLSEGGTDPGQDLQALTDSEKHSHEETHDGLFDTTPSGLVGALRSAGPQDAHRGGPSQSSNPDPRRHEMGVREASGDNVRTVHREAREGAGEDAAAGAGGRSETANERDVSSEIAPHQGSAQSTPSLSVENPVVGGNSKAVGKESKPTRTPKKAKGEGKKVTSLEPVPPPARPDADVPFDVKKILAWGDYARQYAFPHSERSNSKSWKAREAACAIAGLGFTEDFFLLLYFNWMKGVKVDLEPLPDNALKSATWPGYTVDLWVFAEHAREEAAKYREAKSKRERTERTSSQHDETPIVKVLSPEELARKQASLQRAREAKEAIRQEMAAMAAYNAQFQSIGGAR